MTYMSDPNTKRLATRCVVCSLPLRDPASVEIGIGPVCRKKHGYDAEISEATRTAANKLIHLAGCAAEDNDPNMVLACAGRIEALGLALLAMTIRRKFVAVRIEVHSDTETRVFTPYDPRFMGVLVTVFPRGAQIWSKKHKCRVMHPRHHRKLLEALSQVWGGKKALGSKGVFTIPTPTEFTATYAL